MRKATGLQAFCNCRQFSTEIMQWVYKALAIMPNRFVFEHAMVFKKCSFSLILLVNIQHLNA